MIWLLFLFLALVGNVADGWARMVGPAKTLAYGAPILAALVALTVLVP